MRIWLDMRNSNRQLQRCYDGQRCRLDGLHCSLQQNKYNKATRYQEVRWTGAAECHIQCKVLVSTMNHVLTGCNPSTAYQIVEDICLWPRWWCWQEVFFLWAFLQMILRKQNWCRCIIRLQHTYINHLHPTHILLHCSQLQLLIHHLLFCSCVNEVSALLEWDDVSPGTWFPRFQDSTVVSSSRVERPEKTFQSWNETTTISWNIRNQIPSDLVPHPRKTDTRVSQ